MAVTVCGVFQSLVVKVSRLGLTVPSPGSVLDTDSATLAEGALASFTVKVAAPPASVAAPVTAPTTSALSSSCSVRYRSKLLQLAPPARKIGTTRSVRAPKSLLSNPVMVIARVVFAALPAGKFALQETPVVLAPSPLTLKWVSCVGPMKKNSTSVASAAASRIFAVTVAVPPFSEMVAGVRVACPRTPFTVHCPTGASSSSVRVSLAPVTAPMPRALLAEPVTVKVRSASSFELSIAVRVTVSPAFPVLPAGMVIEASAGTDQASECAGTVMVVGSPEAELSVADTVAVPAFSEMEVGVTARATVGVASSSVMVPVPVAVPSVALTGPLSFTTTVSFASSIASPVTETSTFARVTPAAKVRDPAARAV